MTITTTAPVALSFSHSSSQLPMTRPELSVLSVLPGWCGVRVTQSGVQPGEVSSPPTGRGRGPGDGAGAGTNPCEAGNILAMSG